MVDVPGTVSGLNFIFVYVVPYVHVVVADLKILKTYALNIGLAKGHVTLNLPQGLTLGIH